VFEALDQINKNLVGIHKATKCMKKNSQYQSKEFENNNILNCEN
jgi:hypothetical protein